MNRGRQAYVVCPLIEESELVDLKTAMEVQEYLQKDLFPDRNICLIHGKLKKEERQKIMAEFKAGNIDILVATTVIEVGIDVPNATMMIVEHAERFGLSQLHQLRGRVGRGEHESRCQLIALPADFGRRQSAVGSHQKLGRWFCDRRGGLEDSRPGGLYGDPAIGNADSQSRQPASRYEDSGIRQEGSVSFDRSGPAIEPSRTRKIETGHARLLWATVWAC